MLESTSEDYSQYLNIDLESKLLPINQSLDDVLTRLEEFESMVVLVQQERCNAIGLTGALMETMDLQKQLMDLCARVDTLEKLVAYLRGSVDGLEKKIEVAEEQFGLIDNTSKLKNFFMPLFKRSSEVKSSVPVESTDAFSIDKYFTEDDNQ